jgi:hypothetical protein
MLFITLLSVVAALSLVSAAAVAPVQRDESKTLARKWYPIAPKVMIVSYVYRPNLKKCPEVELIWT